MTQQISRRNAKNNKLKSNLLTVEIRENENTMAKELSKAKKG